MKKLLAIFLLLFSLILAGGEKATKQNNLLSALPKTDIYGQPIKYNSNAYLIDVWATWCPPCRQTIPELVALQAENPDILVLGLSVDNSPLVLPQFIKDYKINYPVAMAGESLQALPPIRGIPTMFIVNKEGQIVKTIVGYTSKENLSKEIQKIK